MSPSYDDPTVDAALVREGRVLDGRYSLVRVLGSGGMSVVWLATDRVLDREVAVKILRDQFAADPRFRERFTREALHAARLSHPCVVTTYDAGVDRGTAYLVMELVRGRTLHEVLAVEGPLGPERALAIAADVCDALDAAHRAGIVHRDIKPGNILIGDSGRTQVFDFGIARADGLASLTQVSSVIGTPAYLSPEQAAGGEAEPRSDLYAVGCVLTEMLTGSPPFAAETPVAVLYRHIHDAPPAPSARRPGLSVDVDRAVLRLLAKDPAARPADAAAARADLLAVEAMTARARTTWGAPGPVSDATLVEPLSTLVVPRETSVLDAAEAAAGRAPGPRRRRTSRLAAAALVLAVAVAAFTLTAAFLSGRNGSGTPPRVAAAPPSRSAPSSTPSTAAPRTSATAAPVPIPQATTLDQATAAFRTVVLSAQRASFVDADSVAALLSAADDVAAAQGAGHGRPPDRRARTLVELVDRLAGDGGIAPSAAPTLSAAAAQVRELATR